METLNFYGIDAIAGGNVTDFTATFINDNNNFVTLNGFSGTKSYTKCKISVSIYTNGGGFLTSQYPGGFLQVASGLPGPGSIHDFSITSTSNSSNSINVCVNTGGIFCIRGTAHGSGSYFFPMLTGYTYNGSTEYSF